MSKPIPHLRPSQTFEIGDRVQYVKPDSSNYGTITTVLSELTYVRLQSVIDNAKAEDWVYEIDPGPFDKSTWVFNGVQHWALPRYLRKLPPPAEFEAGDLGIVAEIIQGAKA